MKAGDGGNDERLDLELAQWASYRLWLLRRRETTRGEIERDLNAMPEAKRERAKQWLNFYMKRIERNNDEESKR